MQIYTQEFSKYRDVIIKKNMQISWVTCGYTALCDADYHFFGFLSTVGLLGVSPNWQVGEVAVDTHVSHCVSEKIDLPLQAARPFQASFPFVSRTCAKPLKPGRLNRSISISWKKRCRTQRSARRRSTAAGTASDSAAKSCRRSWRSAPLKLLKQQPRWGKTLIASQKKKWGLNHRRWCPMHRNRWVREHNSKNLGLW